MSEVKTDVIVVDAAYARRISDVFAPRASKGNIRHGVAVLKKQGASMERTMSGRTGFMDPGGATYNFRAALPHEDGTLPDITKCQTRPIRGEFGWNAISTKYRDNSGAVEEFKLEWAEPLTNGEKGLKIMSFTCAADGVLKGLGVSRLLDGDTVGRRGDELRPSYDGDIWEYRLVMQGGRPALQKR